MNIKLAVAISLGASSLALFGMANVANAAEANPPLNQPNPVVNPADNGDDGNTPKTPEEAKKKVDEASEKLKDATKNREQISEQVDKKKKAIDDATNQLGESHEKDIEKVNSTIEEDSSKKSTLEKDLENKKKSRDSVDKDLKEKKESEKQSDKRLEDIDARTKAHSNAVAAEASAREKLDNAKKTLEKDEKSLSDANNSRSEHAESLNNAKKEAKKFELTDTEKEQISKLENDIRNSEGDVAKIDTKGEATKLYNAYEEEVSKALSQKNLTRKTFTDFLEYMFERDKAKLKPGSYAYADYEAAIKIMKGETVPKQSFAKDAGSIGGGVGSAAAIQFNEAKSPSYYNPDINHRPFAAGNLYQIQQTLDCYKVINKARKELGEEPLRISLRTIAENVVTLSRHSNALVKTGYNSVVDGPGFLSNAGVSEKHSTRINKDLYETAKSVMDDIRDKKTFTDKNGKVHTLKSGITVDNILFDGKDDIFEGEDSKSATEELNNKLVLYKNSIAKTSVGFGLAYSSDVELYGGYDFFRTQNTPGMSIGQQSCYLDEHNNQTCVKDPDITFDGIIDLPVTVDDFVNSFNEYVKTEITAKNETIVPDNIDKLKLAENRLGSKLVDADVNEIKHFKDITGNRVKIDKIKQKESSPEAIKANKLVEDLTKAISKDEEAIASANKSLDASRPAFSEANNLYNKAKDNLNSNPEVPSSEINEAKTLASELKETISSLTNKLGQIDSEINSTESEVNTLDTNIKDNQKKLESLRTLQKTYNENSAKIASMKSEYNDLTSKLELAKKAENEAKENLSKANKVYQKLLLENPVTPPAPKPVDPVTPVTPPAPKPVEPVEPVNPVTPPAPKPVDPVTPVTPPAPNPVVPPAPKPVEPVNPVTPPAPAPEPPAPKPVEPVNPVTPHAPKPVEPVNPVTPPAPSPNPVVPVVDTTDSSDVNAGGVYEVPDISIDDIDLSVIDLSDIDVNDTDTTDNVNQTEDDYSSYVDDIDLSDINLDDDTSPNVVSSENDDIDMDDIDLSGIDLDGISSYSTESANVSSVDDINFDDINIDYVEVDDDDVNIDDIDLSGIDLDDDASANGNSYGSDDTSTNNMDSGWSRILNY